MPEKEVSTYRHALPVSRRRGFTLVELLLVIAIGGTCLAAAVTLLFGFVGTFEQNNDFADAQQNGLSALSTIGPYALMGGLGMPQSFILSIPPIGGTVFRKPVSVDPSGIWFVSSFPQGAAATQDYAVSGQNVTIQLSASVQLRTDADLQGGDWVVFPPSTTFFQVRGTGVSTVTLSGDGTIKRFSELHKVDAAHFFPNGEDLIKNDCRGGNQPIVENIFALSCDWYASGAAIITVLAGSGTRHGIPIGQTVPGWSHAIPGHDRRYVAISRIWGVRNWKR